VTALLDPVPGAPAGLVPDQGAAGSGGGGSSGAGLTAVEVVVPVHNEESDLGPSIRRLYAYLGEHFPVTWRITVVDGVPAGLPRQLGRFALIGAISTLAYVLLFLLLRPIGPQQANALALLITAVANTAANRRITFPTRGRDGAMRHQFQGLVVFAIGLMVSSGALALVHLLSPGPSALIELIALVLANLLATLLRFVLLKSWVFRPAQRSTRSLEGKLR
jgi:putative flippase GtrA